jgi:multicomponent Na+:H+ antiporter subunit F
MLALLALLPALLVPVAATWRGSIGSRLAAVQLASAVATPMLVLMTFAFDQSSFIDLAFTLCLLTLPGLLLYALFYERWL